MALPNFLIIGAARSGTTSLHKYLQQHPQVFMPRLKEPMFFACENEDPVFHGPGGDERIPQAVNNIAQYLALFHDVTDEKAVGEASPQYLSSTKAPERIKYYIPKAKLIAILRHPVEVAYSAFLQQRRSGREPVADFAQAIRDEEQRAHDNWSFLFLYRRRGFYYEHLLRYYQLFPREQLKVCLNDDLKMAAPALMQDIFRYLEVDENFVPELWMKHNMSIIPKSMTLHKFINKSYGIKSALSAVVPQQLRGRVQQNLNQWNLGTLPSPTEETRQHLIAQYREDILRVQDLIQRDLSTWLES